MERRYALHAVRHIWPSKMILLDLKCYFLFIFFSIIWCNIVNYLLYTVILNFDATLQFINGFCNFYGRKFPQTNFVRFLVLSQIYRIPEFSLIHDLGMLKMKTYDDPLCPQCLTDVWIRFFGPKSGFLKPHF